jgi:ABC-type transport system involved in multi-copper enzyme maturation permease subunit
MTAGTITEPTGFPLSHFTDILRSEQCKLLSVRSTFWTLLAAAVFNIGLAALLAIVLPGQISSSDLEGVDPVRVSLGGIHLSQIAFGVLGVLVITSEYGTGMIRATIAAVPQRRLLLAAKVIVFSATALIVGVLTSFAAFFTFQGFLTGDSLGASLGDPGVLRAVTGGGLFLSVLGLFGLGLGAIIRSSAGAIAAVFGLLFVPPFLVDLLPPAWKATVGPYIPMDAGGQIYLADTAPGSLGAWTGFAVFCLYAVIALGIGFTLISRRDA